MAAVVIDYLFDFLSLADVPDAQNTYIICSDTCQVNDDILAVFNESTDIERLVKGGKYISRVTNDIQSGFLLSYLINKLQAEVYSHRPELISRLFGVQNVRCLQTPDKLFESKPNAAPLAQASGNWDMKQPVDSFDKVYQDSLEKYVETILCQPIRATKIKSAKGQLKNIVDGIVISLTKRSNIKVEFSSEDISDSIFADLESHGIIAQSMAAVSYFDEWIESYFGKRKVKIFVPRHRSGAGAGDREHGLNPAKMSNNPNTSGQNREEEKLDMLIPTFLDNILLDGKYNSIKSVGELSHLLKLTLNELSRDYELNTVQKDKMHQKLFPYVIQQLFNVEQGKSYDDISKDPNAHFALKIVRKP